MLLEPSVQFRVKVLLEPSVQFRVKVLLEPPTPLPSTPTQKTTPATPSHHNETRIVSTILVPTLQHT